MMRLLSRSPLAPIVAAAAFAVAVSTPAMADPLVITTTNNATTLANTLLSGSSGITNVSATYTGGDEASGTFTGGTGIIGFEGGLLLTSGTATGVTGPNTGSAFTGFNLSLGTALIADSNNASLLEINFTPNGDSIEFSYVFGSEEYNDYVNSEFNDAFLFLVNGVNYALIPSTTTSVAINNVNNGEAGSDQVAAGPCVNCTFYRDNALIGGLGLNTQLDGLTTVLSFVAPVNSGINNLLQLVIADVGDSSLDSAVFLQGGSLQVCGDPPLPPCGGTTETATNETTTTEPTTTGTGGDTVPEPATLGLLGMGLAAIAARRRRAANRR